MLLPLRRLAFGDRYLATVDGRPMVVNLADRGFTARLFYRSSHEPETMAIFRRLVRPGMTVFDVGAHIGFYTVQASEAVGPDGHVFAFEPDPVNRALLEENLGLNACTNVTVVPCALSDAAGELTLHRSGYNSGDHRIYDDASDPGFHRGGTRTEVRVKTLRLDDFVAEHGLLPDVLKCDIQGAECRMWTGMRDTVERSRGLRLLMEYWPHGIRGCGDDPEELFRWISEAGFTVWSIEKDGSLPERQAVELIASLPAEKHMNIVCSRTPLPE
jgi:FkbM family methyltransferase